MGCLETIFVIWVILNITMFFLFVMTGAFSDYGFVWLNPLFIYKHIDVNWFGALLLTLVANVIFVPYAILYWFYKVCTVGRK